ncbi:Organic cation transporter, partial [Operophtera brumata]
MAASERNHAIEKAEWEKEKRKINLDTILIEEIGQFGKFQLRTLMLALLVVVFAGWASTEYLFTTARINTRCHIPECDTEDAEYSPDWILNAVPSSGSSLDNCQRYGNSSISAQGACPAELFDTSVLLPCQEHVYENTNTVVYDFELACDEWRRTLIGSVRTIGTLINLPITGYISDRWGRRTVLVVTTLNSALIGVTRYWTNTYIGFLISEVVEATLGSVTEITGPKYRLAVGAAMGSFFSVSQISMGLIAWALPNWRKLTLTLYIPQFSIIAYFWIITESVRWYMSKGYYDESEALLEKIARTNGKQLSTKSIVALRQTAEDEKKRKEESVGKKEPWLIILVFRHKRVLLRCLVSPVWWMTTTFIYYGMSINSVNMVGNRYLNYIAVSAVEIPGYWTAVVLMGKLGRKPVLIGAFWVCAACQVAYIFLPSGKYCIAMEMTTLYMYTAELYPTRHRHSLFAFSSMMGRIGAIVAPLTPAF